MSKPSPVTDRINDALFARIRPDGYVEHFTRAEVAKEVECSISAVARAVDMLVREGLLVEVEPHEHPVPEGYHTCIKRYALA